MTLLNGTDGATRDYLEIAETLQDVGSRTSDDLRQLWRRIAFSIAIHNTDDHLRNHGLLRGGSGWQLSPAFDLNPNPDVGAHRVTGIGGGYTREDEVNGLMTYAASFDVTPAVARVIVDDVVAATAEWRKHASRNGIPASEQSRFTRSLDARRGLLQDGLAILR